MTVMTVVSSYDSYRVKVTHVRHFNYSTTVTPSTVTRANRYTIYGDTIISYTIYGYTGERVHGRTGISTKVILANGYMSERVHDHKVTLYTGYMIYRVH